MRIVKVWKWEPLAGCSRIIVAGDAEFLSLSKILKQARRSRHNRLLGDRILTRADGRGGACNRVQRLIDLGSSGGTRSLSNFVKIFGLRRRPLPPLSVFWPEIYLRRPHGRLRRSIPASTGLSVDDDGASEAYGK